MDSDVVDLSMEHVPFGLSLHDVDCSPCLDGFPSSDTQIFESQDTEKDTHVTRCQDLGSTSGAMAGETSRVRNVTLEKLRARLHVPPEGQFDRTDIVWEEITNQGRGRRGILIVQSFLGTNSVILWLESRACETSHALSTRFPA